MSKSIFIQGEKLHYAVSGRNGAPWLVLSHSLAADMSMWDAQLPMLETWFQVLRFDTPGHGQSDVPAEDISIEMMAERVAGLMDQLAIEKAHFMGLSLGGMLGLGLAIARPERVLSLVLADTTAAHVLAAAPMWADRAKSVDEGGMQAVVDGTLHRWFTPAFSEAQPARLVQIRQMILATPPKGFSAACRVIPRMNFTPRLKEISCPTLVIVGAEDEATPPSHSQVLQQRIPGASLTTLAGAAHVSAVEQPQAFNQALQAFYLALPGQ